MILLYPKDIIKIIFLSKFFSDNSFCPKHFTLIFCDLINLTIFVWLFLYPKKSIFPLIINLFTFLLTVQILNNKLYPLTKMISSNKNSNNQDHFNVLRMIKNKPKASQRELALQLGFSLGKLNYCIKALKKQRVNKIENFRNHPKKINYIYILTAKGITEKTKLTINFMKRKMTEYDELKREIEKDN